MLVLSLTIVLLTTQLIDYVSAGPVQVQPSIQRPLYYANNPGAYGTDSDADDDNDDIGPSPRNAALRATRQRPYERIENTERQSIPPMQVVQRLTRAERLGPEGPLSRQAVLEVRARPPGYRPLIDSQAGRQSCCRRHPQPPALQLLPSCEQFERGWLKMLSLVNEYRRGVLGPGHDLCMNGRLMEAAKLQSDFQGLAKVPTHAGPQMAGFGSLEDRLVWFGFGNKSRSDRQGGGADPSHPFPDNEDESSRRPFTAAEVLHYWPVGPRILPAVALERRLEEAMAAWKTCPRQAAILGAPDWNFFGYGYYRGPNGATYLTIVLASSPFEVCHTCPTAETRACLTRHMEQAAPWAEEYDKLFS